MNLLSKSAGLPPLSPLRTVRASFPAYGSSDTKFNSHEIKLDHWLFKPMPNKVTRSRERNEALRSFLFQSTRTNQRQTGSPPSWFPGGAWSGYPLFSFMLRLFCFLPFLAISANTHFRFPTVWKYLSLIHPCDLLVWRLCINPPITRNKFGKSVWHFIFVKLWQEKGVNGARIRS